MVSVVVGVLVVGKQTNWLGRASVSTGCEIKFDLPNTAVCWYDAKKAIPVTFTVKKLPSTGGPYYVQTDWFLASPKPGDHHYLQDQQIVAGGKYTMYLDWPGVLANSKETVEVHAGLNVLDKNKQILNSACSAGLDYYWTPYVCVAPTAGGSVRPTVTLVPTLLPTVLPTIRSTVPPTIVPTVRVTPVTTTTPTLTIVPSPTLLAMANTPIPTATLVPTIAPTGIPSQSTNTSCIAGQVIEDTNKNGVQDGSEPGLDGFTVMIYSSDNRLVATTTTSGGGHYEVCGLSEGSYTIKFVSKTGYMVVGSSTTKVNLGNSSILGINSLVYQSVTTSIPKSGGGSLTILGIVFGIMLLGLGTILI